MIRNWYNYLKFSVKDTNERHSLSNGTTIKRLQVESQKDSFFSKHWPTAIQNKTFHQDTKTYNDRNCKPQKKKRLGKVSRIFSVVF